jgi:hypothetical protein
MTTATRSLWPDDLKTEDVRTANEILNEQAQLLEKQTNGLLTGSIADHIVQERRVLGFDVNAPRVPTTVRLFEVYQSPTLAYPVRIVPPKDDIPDYLKKKVYRPGIADLAVPAISRGHWEEQLWVADSAEEFTKKLEELLTSPAVKGTLFSLLSRSKRVSDGSIPPPTNSTA